MTDEMPDEVDTPHKKKAFKKKLEDNPGEREKYKAGLAKWEERMQTRKRGRKNSNEPSSERKSKLVANDTSQRRPRRPRHALLPLLIFISTSSSISISCTFIFISTSTFAFSFTSVATSNWASNSISSSVAMYYSHF